VNGLNTKCNFLNYSILMSLWKTVQQGFANLNLDCNNFCTNISSHPPNDHLQSARYQMNAYSPVNYIPLKRHDNPNTCRKKSTPVKCDDGSTSPPHGGKKRRENLSSFKTSNSDVKYGPPWVSRNYSQGMVGLHEEILDFYDFLKPTKEEHEMRSHVIKSVRDVVVEMWPHVKVEVFGSFRTNLYLPTSDIDIVLFGEWDVLPLWTLKEALCKNRIADENSVKVLDRAAVPLVKFQHLETLIKVDISFNVKNGLQSVQFVKEHLEKYPVLPKLIMVLKQFLLLRDLNEVWTGGVSSYSVIIMCISFLQMHPRCDARTSSANIGVLLLEFFELYGRHFNYHNTCIRVKNGGRYIHKDEFRRQMENNSSPSPQLSIEDPLTPGNDLGRGSYAVLQVKQSFEYAYRTLTSAIFQLHINHYKFHPVSILSLVVSVSERILLDRRESANRWRRCRKRKETALAASDNVSANSPSSSDDESISSSRSSPICKERPGKQTNNNTTKDDDQDQVFSTKSSNNHKKNHHHHHHQSNCKLSTIPPQTQPCSSSSSVKPICRSKSADGCLQKTTTAPASNSRSGPNSSPHHHPKKSPLPSTTLKESAASRLEGPKSAFEKSTKSKPEEDAQSESGSSSSGDDCSPASSSPAVAVGNNNKEDRCKNASSSLSSSSSADEEAVIQPNNKAKSKHVQNKRPQGPSRRGGPTVSRAHGNGCNRRNYVLMTNQRQCSSR